MSEQTKIPFYILPIIVFAQFAGTSLWFAGNAVAADLQIALHLDSNAIGNITSAVQFGFIVGTLVFAFFSLADRFSPSKVFFVSALFGAFFNLSVYLFENTLLSLLVFRFLTGFFLAGIYPVGMKIAADWFPQGLGKALGYLVGALVLGTAFPHLIKAFTQTLPWENIMVATSILAAFGGVLLLVFVSDGPHRKQGAKFDWKTIPKIFQFKEFRNAAFGYFGHMWELYTIWAFLPLILQHYNHTNASDISISLWAFLIIGIGSLGCILGGYISLKKGSRKVAFFMLLISGICCLLSPVFYFFPKIIFLLTLLLWGFTIVGDSPQFSTIVARTAPKLYVGTALTIVNSIGFALTIFSIQLVNLVQPFVRPEFWFWVLLPGIIFGLVAVRK